VIDRTRIFVGSSSEALRVAELVARLIEDAGMEPVLWNTVFPAGEILLEKIEQLPTLVDAAVLLATPDLVCEREYKNDRLSSPVANVIFEYGYLSARLLRKRVAICWFEGVEMPSDLQGLTTVRAGTYKKGTLADLPPESKAGLGRWLAGLPHLVAGVSPTSQVHGYSGTWSVQNRFTLWHGISLVPNVDKVTFDGKALLHLRSDGQQGYGTQIGQLTVAIGQYHAKWDVANEVIKAAVNQNGDLTMRVRVCARTLVLGSETGTPPSDRVHEALPSPEWIVNLTPVSGEPLKLEGTHSYPVATEVYSTAKEDYTYIDA